MSNEFGMIVLKHNEARALYWILADERLRLLDERRYARASGVNLTSYQQMTGLIKEIRSQIELLCLENGWELGSPEYANR